MHFFEIKFKLEYHLIDIIDLDDTFKKIGQMLDFRFDENLNHYEKENERKYKFIDVSNQNENYINEKINSFFEFEFDEIINVPLYKFLVVKNNENLTVFANISSSIFDYTLIKNIQNLFNDPQYEISNKIIAPQKTIEKYLDSPEFDKDCDYWNKILSDTENHIKFYNIHTDSYKNKNIAIDNKALDTFLKNNNISRFNFITGIFSLYLSRIDKTNGCLLKSSTLNNDFRTNTLFKIDYEENKSLNDYLNKIKKQINENINHTKVDVENYVDIKSFYAINDFTSLEGVSIFNGEGSALTLNVFANELELIYNDELFEDIYIEHMIRNIESLICNVLDSPSQICCDIDIVCDDEKSLIFEFSKGKRTPMDLDKTLSMAFRENSIKYPDVTAIDDGVCQITYAELESSSNSIAYDLNNNFNISLGDRVGLMLPRGYHFPEMVLALNKIGAAFIPIDSDYPLKRIEHMLNIGEANCIITTKEFSNLHDFNVDIICIEDLKYDLNVDIDIECNKNDLFSIMFTSGTTGVPKGVMVPNKQISGVGYSLKRMYDSALGDVSGCHSNFSFTASFRMYFALYFGETCRLFNDKERKDSLLFIQALKDQPLNDLILPPSLCLSIFENEEDINVKYLMSAGAKLDRIPNNDDTQFINLYGTTETSMAVACNLNPEIDNIPIGKAIDNTWAYILDENKNLVPIGVPGYLYLSNSFLSLGYYNRPDLTNKVFIDNPHSDCEDNVMMYQTGDVAFYNFNGEIEIIGRTDDQLSVRGFRVESSEILNIMKGFDSISEICMDVDNDNLIAYYTTSDSLNIDEVKNALKSELPPYMIPSLFIELDEIPLNPNGKIDKASLKKIAQNNESAEIKDKVLSHIVDSFKKILNIDSVSTEDNFVSLGGNSLSAMKLQLLLKNKLEVTLSSHELMELSTPKNIYNYIKSNSNTGLDNFDVNYDFKDICPLSESQLNVYLDESVKDMGTAYNTPFKMEFDKSDDIEGAIDKLIEMYPILSARIIVDDNVPSFCFDAKPQIKKGSVNDIEEFVQPFELDKSLSRFLIVEDEESKILCVDCHHLIFDGTSFKIILESFDSILNGLNNDYVDNGVLRQISFEENNIVDSDYMENAQKFFDGMLVDEDECLDLLPSIDSDGGTHKYEDYLKISKENFDSFLHENSITYNQFFTSVFAYTLSRFTGSTKVMFNLVGDGRGHLDLSNSIGMFVRTLPLLVNCENQKTKSFLKYASELVKSAMKYDLYPYRILANEYKLTSDILFQYAHNLLYTDENKKFTVEDLKHEELGDLSFYVYNYEDYFKIKATFSDKYSQDLIEHFIESFKLISHELMNKESLSNINYTLKSDLNILDEYNNTQNELKYNDILEAFNNNLSKYPDNTLVKNDDSEYTYTESAYLINSINSILNQNNLSENDVISVFVDRNHWALFSSLSCLSLGITYVPIDENLPDKRIAFMIEQSKSKAIITTDTFEPRVKDIIKEFKLKLDVINLSSMENHKNDHHYVDYIKDSENDVACILYTSGTTGTPKAVQMTKLGILNLMEFYIDSTSFTSEDVQAIFASVGFDVSLEQFASIFTGGAVTYVPNDIRFDINKLNDYFIKQNATHTLITTQIAKLFVNTIPETSLKVLQTAGEKLGSINPPKDYILSDVYGPTEANYITSIDVDKKIDETSVGFANWNIKTYILDKEHRRVPCGAIGELYISGYQTTKGYMDNPEANKKSIFLNSFDGEIEGYKTMYATGDLCRYLPDGSIGIVGRIDSQVKIRGNRVELSEVEAVIRKIDYVEDIAVKTVKNGDNNELVAYVVVSNDLDGNELRNAISTYVSESKPSYMVPSFVIRLDDIPLNVNGKVDKRKLPEVTIESKDYEDPKDYFEMVIANVFSEVLNTDKPISRNDEFSSLGGDSIGVIKLISKLRELNISLTVKDVLNNQSVKRIAEKAEYKMSINNIRQESFEGFVDTTPNVQYFNDLNLKNPSYYLRPFLLEASKRIDKDVLEEAMMHIVNYHDILRAKVKDGKLFVRPQNDEGIFTIEYCNSLDYYEETKRINEEIDIFNGPLIKLAIFKDNEADYLYVCIHRLLIDSDSIRIIMNDLNFAYAQISNNMEVELSNKTSTYKDYAVAINEYGDNDDVFEQKTYWENTLQSLKELPHTEINSNAKRDHYLIKLPKIMNSILFVNAPKYYNCSINGLFLSMILKAWNNVMGENEISVRLNCDGRKHFDKNISTERTVGWLNSYYPVILKYENQNNKETISNIEKTLNDVPHNGFAYPTLMGIEPHETPLLSFHYTNEFNKVGGGKMFNAKTRDDLASFTAPENNFASDISIDGFTLHNITYLKFEYNSERFTRELMEKFGRSVLTNLNETLFFTKEDYSGDAYVFSNHPDKKKLFFVHSANFGSEYFYYMAQKLKDDYSFIVIEPYNRIHKENQCASIEEFAKKYIEIIKSIQPEGPYYIGGYCFGGIIAHEMAVQLKKQNDKVDKLILFESYYFDDDAFKESLLEEQILYIREFLKDGVLNPKHENIEDMISYALSTINIMYDYTPSYYDGDVIYFNATLENEWLGTDERNNLFSTKKAGGYEDFYDSKKLLIKDVPAGHDHMLNVEPLEVIIPELMKFIDGSD